MARYSKHRHFIALLLISGILLYMRNKHKSSNTGGLFWRYLPESTTDKVISKHINVDGTEMTVYPAQKVNHIKAKKSSNSNKENKDTAGKTDAVLYDDSNGVVDHIKAKANNNIGEKKMEFVGKMDYVVYDYFNETWTQTRVDRIQEAKSKDVADKTDSVYYSDETETTVYNSSSETEPVVYNYTPLTASEIETMLSRIHATVETMTVKQTKGFPRSQDISLLPGYKNPCWGNGTTISCLPYFFIGGFPKSGTTELFSKVTYHPQVLRGRRKEPHFWTRRRFKKKFSLRFYETLFKDAIARIQNKTENGFHPLVMTEGSASTVWDNKYLFGSDQVHPEHLNMHFLHAIHPSAKFVLIVRNPSKRVYSDYLYFQKTYSPHEFHNQVMCALSSFTKCLRDSQYDPLFCTYSMPSSVPCKMFRRIRISLYYIHISILQMVYPKENVHVARLEDYAKQGADVLMDIFKFLELDPIDRKTLDAILSNRARNRNKKGYYKAGDMLNLTKNVLDDFYRPFNRHLSQLLQDDRFRYE